jgi:hypothetical protein
MWHYSLALVSEPPTTSAINGLKWVLLKRVQKRRKTEVIFWLRNGADWLNKKLPKIFKKLMNELMQSDFILYTTPEGKVKVDVFIQGETLWLTQKMMGELFGVQLPAISKHLKNIFESGELEENSVISILETTAPDGKTYKTKYYNLDAIIAVGYRVNSARATQFRIWATRVLKEYIIKGFTLDDERLKQGKKVFGEDYFKELLERVRSIRASERRIYQQITDIFAECSIDYDPKSDITKNFFALVQNKFHYAITGQTAPEIIYHNVDSAKPNNGLTTWKNAPNGRILSSDVTIAKNYLQEQEIKRLERTVAGLFDILKTAFKPKWKIWRVASISF